MKVLAVAVLVGGGLVVCQGKVPQDKAGQATTTKEIEISGPNGKVVLRSSGLFLYGRDGSLQASVSAGKKGGLLKLYSSTGFETISASGGDKKSPELLITAPTFNDAGRILLRAEKSLARMDIWNPRGGEPEGKKRQGSRCSLLADNDKAMLIVKNSATHEDTGRGCTLESTDKRGRLSVGGSDQKRLEIVVVPGATVPSIDIINAKGLKTPIGR